MKGQKLLAQGSALGIMAIGKAPCVRATALKIIKSFKAFALTQGDRLPPKTQGAALG